MSLDVKIGTKLRNLETGKKAEVLDVGQVYVTLRLEDVGIIMPSKELLDNGSWEIE